MVLVGLGWLIQVFALTILFVKLGRRWYRHIGAIFIVMAVLYHGIGEVFIRLFPGQDPYRNLFNVAYVNPFMVWISLAILAFTIAYLWVVRRIAAPQDEMDRTEVQLTKSLFDYRVMLIVTVPLLVLTLGDRVTDLMEGWLAATG